MVRHKIEKKPEKNARGSFPPVPGEKKKLISPEMQQKLNVNLLLAAKAGQWGRAKRLIEEGASPEETDGINYSALTYASAAGESGLVRKMIKKGGFDIDEPPNYSAVLLAQRGGHQDIVEFFGKNMREKTTEGVCYARAMRELIMMEKQG